MLRAEEIATLDCRIMGQAFILAAMPKHENATLEQIAKLAWRHVSLRDKDASYCSEERMYKFAARVEFIDRSLETAEYDTPAIDAISNELGEYGGYICYMLAQGYTSRYLARILDVAENNIAKRILRIRNTCDQNNF